MIYEIQITIERERLMHTEEQNNPTCDNVKSFMYAYIAHTCMLHVVCMHI